MDALLLSAERLRLATEIAGVGVFDWDIESGVNVWSPELEAMYGLAPGEFEKTQSAWESLVHEEDRADAVALVEEALATGAPVHGEWRVVWRDDSLHWILGRFRCLKDEDGSPLHLIGVNLDVTERKLTESALGESAERYRQLFRSISDAVFLLDHETGRIVDANATAVSLYGFEQQELLGLTDLDLSAEPELTRAVARSAVIGKNLHVTGRRHRRKDGSTFIAEITARIFLLGGRTVRVAIVRDVSEQVETNRALLESRERLRIATDATGLGVHDYDVLTGRIQWDARIRAMWGVPSSEAVTYETFMGGIHPDDREHVQAAVDAALSPGGEGHLSDTYRVISRDGTRRWVRATGSVSFENGQPVRLVGTAEDVTSRVEGEQALRESEQRFRSLADHSPFLIYVHDADGQLVFVNRTYREFFGVGEDVVAGAGWQPFVHPEDSERYVSEFMNATRERRPFTCEARVRNAAGEWRWIDSRAIPRLSSSGEFLGMVGAAPDITERKRAEADLRKQGAERAAQEERNRIARDLHDSVTQSLFAATLKTEALTIEGDQTPAAAAALEEIRRLSRGALAQMRTLLLELRGDPVEEVPLEQLLRHLAEAAESRASMSVSLALDVKASIPPRVHEAAYRIAQESLNNVVKHAKAENAWVQLKSDPDGVLLVVGDDGRGYDPASTGQGHFGLASIRERAQETNGQATITSAVEDGTVVRVSWRFE